MVLVEVDSVVVLATGVTATSGMLSVLADAAVTVRHVATKLPGLLPVSTHVCKGKELDVRQHLDKVAGSDEVERELEVWLGSFSTEQLSSKESWANKPSLLMH